MYQRYKRFARRAGRLVHEYLGDPLIGRTLIPNPTASTPTNPGEVDILLTDFLYRRYGRAQKSQTGTTTLSIEGFSNAAIGGGTAPQNFQDSTGLYNDIIATAGVGQEASVSGGNFTSDWTQPDWEPLVFYRMKTGPVITSQRIFAGLYATAPTNSDTPPNHSACFRYSSVVPDANWKALTRDGTTTNTTDTGVAVVADERYHLLILLSTTEALFYINETLVATHTTNLPASGTDMSLRISLFNQDAGATRRFRFAIETSMTY